MGSRLAVLRVTASDPKSENLEIPLAGRGTPVLADQNEDSAVDGLDLLEFLSVWRMGNKTRTANNADQNGDGILNDFDVFLFADQWEPAIGIGREKERK